MKPSAILFVFLLLTGLSTQAQKFYLRGGGGIALSTAAEITADNTESIYKFKKAGVGTGIPFVVAAGYKFSNNLGFELGIDYFFGIPGKSTWDYEAPANTGSDEKTRYTGVFKTRGQMLALVPAVFFSYPVKKLHPYARLGLKIGVLNNVTTEQHETDRTMDSVNIQQINTKDYGGISVGVQAAIGADFALNDKISLFGEIQVDGISYSPKHGKYTQMSSNGVDILGKLEVINKEWNYKKDVDNMQNIPPDQPWVRSMVNHHFGNAGIVIGVKITL